MFDRRMLKMGLPILLVLILAFTLVSCGPENAGPAEGGQPAEGSAEEPSTEGGEGEEAATGEEENVVTILIADEPTGFNGLINDSGYEVIVGELVMLSLAEVDPNGVVFPEIAAELPTVDNGGVEID